MNTRKPGIVIAGVLLLISCAAFAQAQKPQGSAPSVVIEYIDNASGNLAIYDQGKNAVQFDIGTRLLPGWTVVTDKGDVVELKLDPNGTIIKVSQVTNFKVDSLQSAAGEINTFSVAIGKIRAVAGKATGQEKYNVQGPSAVCGVRGTDFGFDVETDKETAFVLDGEIEFTKTATGETVEISKGMMADAMAPEFKPVQIPADFLQEIHKDLDFEKLSPQDVPGHGPGSQAAGPGQGGPLDGVMGWLRNILGMEIGSITISGNTYAKVVISPQFSIGDLKLGLYLPIIYTDNMFDPGDYYRPAGNDEWNFGVSASAWDPLDAFNDLVLKIKYIEYGKQRDPFYFKAGNLDDITIGHGVIMRDYANDADFPAVRRVGLNLGLDLGGFGMEAMMDDAALPQIVGGRLFARPIPGFRAALGVSLLADLNPAGDLGNTAVEQFGHLMFFNPGVDIDLPFMESDDLSVIAFADMTTMVPYLQSGVSVPMLGLSVPSGLHTETLWDSGLKNYGIAGGVLGNILMLDYRLEYRYFKGIVQPAFYNTIYERTRALSVLGTLFYLSDPSNPAFDRLEMGIYGEAGFTLDKILSLKIGYYWPWEYDSSGNIVPDYNDHFLATFTLEKGVIPIVNLSGSVSYERNNFVSTITQSGDSKGLSLFDANTVVSAKIAYSATPNVDVILLYAATARRDGSGNIVYDTGSLLPQLDTTLAIQTSIHF